MHIWTDEEREYIKSYRKIKRSVLVDKFNAKFNANVTNAAITQQLNSMGLLKDNSPYTPEMCEWIKNNYDLVRKSCGQLVKEFNAAFGTTYTKSSLWHKAYRLTNMRKHEVKRIRADWTPEMCDRLRELHPYWSHNWIANKLSDEFGKRITPSAVEHKCSRLGLPKKTNGGGYGNLDPHKPIDNWFTRGHEPPNLKPVGTEVIHTYTISGKQYWCIKTGPDKWEYKHRVVWMQHYGEIPEGCMITFLDGDTLNCSIENLICINKSENAIMNNKRLRTNDAELTSLGLDVARLILKIGERKDG